MTFLLVTHAGVDTLHQEHPFEECNTDDATRTEKIDAATAAALIAAGSARTCEFCEPVPVAEDMPADQADPVDEEERPTLDTRGPDDR